MKILILAVCLLSLLSPPLQAEKIQVVTFSTVLTEIAERVGKEHVQVFGLIKPGIDPHDYEPSPADLKLVGSSQLVLLSAKHMEGYLGKLQQVTQSGARVVEVGDQFPSLKLAPHQAAEASSSRHDESMEDPHWWHSITNVRRATKVVQDELTRLSPGNQADFAAQAAAYNQELTTLESWARSEVAKIPRNQRKLVTSHDAFQYFAQSFGFTIHPIEGITPEDQPSSKGVAELITIIKREQVKAIFLESIQNPKVAQEITRETGAKIGGTLYADGLGEGDAATYSGMYRHNVSTIVEALR